MKKSSVRFTVIALTFTIIWTMIQHFAGWNTTDHATGQYTRMVAAVVFYILIFAAIFERRKQLGGHLRFGQGLATGAVLSALYSAGCCIWYALYGEVINRSFKPTLMAFERAKLAAANTSSDQAEAAMKQVDMTSGGSILSYLFLVLFMFVGGCIVSLVAAAVFRRSARHRV